jgi:hypothetical protein
MLLRVELEGLAERTPLELTSRADSDRSVSKICLSPESSHKMCAVKRGGTDVSE